MNFFNLHVLHTLPYSNLNRDDVGAPKTLMYGGVPRARLSSQSLKRHQRLAFEFESTADITSRSKMHATDIANRAAEKLHEAGTDLNEKDRKALEKKITDDLKKLTSGGDSGKDTLIWIAESERDRIIDRAVALYSAEELDLTSEIDEGNTGSLSVAAFGRFFANAPKKSMNAAIQVAHAFTTHQQAKELDFFTAVDDLRKSIADDAGSGHLDVAEYTSGVFYRYANIDRRQLALNWNGLSQPDGPSRFEILLRAMLTIVPSGKENTTAPHTPPSLIMVECSTQPLSYATAFESAVPDSDYGFEAASIDRLLDYALRVRNFDPETLGEQKIASVARPSETTLAELLNFGAQWVQQA